jgi:hypothetical protein
MKTLADHLGVPPLRESDTDPDYFSEEMSDQDFCRGILTSREYRRSILRRIEIDELPAAIELMLYDRAYGTRQKNLKIEHSDRPFQGWDDEHLAERELALVRHLRQLRTNGTGEPSDEEGDTPRSVH